MFLEASNKWKSTNTAVCILSPKINASLKPHIKPSVKVWVNDLLCFCWSWSAHLSFLYRHTCLVLKKKTITYYVMVNLHCIFPKSQSFKSKLWESTHLIISYRIYVVLRGCAPWPLDFPKHPPTFPQKKRIACLRCIASPSDCVGIISGSGSRSSSSWRILGDI